MSPSQTRPPKEACSLYYEIERPPQPHAGPPFAPNLIGLSFTGASEDQPTLHLYNREPRSNSKQPSERGRYNSPIPFLSRTHQVILTVRPDTPILASVFLSRVFQPPQVDQGPLVISFFTQPLPAHLSFKITLVPGEVTITGPNVNVVQPIIT